MKRQAIISYPLDSCNATRYDFSVIRSFRHKGVKNFFETGSTAVFSQRIAKRLRLQLTRLNASTIPGDMNAPGWKLHPLKADLAGHWSVNVDGNWRLTFTFEGENAVLVDYQDYH